MAGFGISGGKRFGCATSVAAFVNVIVIIIIIITIQIKYLFIYRKSVLSVVK
jgi:hypothetical protein